MIDLNIAPKSICNLHHENIKHTSKQIEQLELAYHALIDACNIVDEAIKKNSLDIFLIDTRSLRLGGSLVLGVAQQIRTRLDSPLNERASRYAKARR